MALPYKLVINGRIIDVTQEGLYVVNGRIFSAKGAGVGPTPPVLTNPTSADITTSSATIGCTTDTSDSSTAYWYVSQSATPPSVADHKSGAGSDDFGSVTASTATLTASTTGLAADTTYYFYWLQDNGADSNQLQGTFDTLPAAQIIDADVNFGLDVAQDSAKTADILGNSDSEVFMKLDSGANASMGADMVSDMGLGTGYTTLFAVQAQIFAGVIVDSDNSGVLTIQADTENPVVLRELAGAEAVALASVSNYVALTSTSTAQIEAPGEILANVTFGLDSSSTFSATATALAAMVAGVELTDRFIGEIELAGVVDAEALYALVLSGNA